MQKQRNMWKFTWKLHLLLFCKIYRRKLSRFGLFLTIGHSVAFCPGNNFKYSSVWPQLSLIPIYIHLLGMFTAFFIFIRTIYNLSVPSFFPVKGPFLILFYFSFDFKQRWITVSTSLAKTTEHVTMAVITILATAVDILKDETVQVVFKCYVLLLFHLDVTYMALHDLFNGKFGLSSFFVICRDKLLLLQTMLKQWHLPEHFGWLSMFLSCKVQWKKLWTR